MTIPILPWQMDDLTEQEAELLFEYRDDVKKQLRKRRG